MFKNEKPKVLPKDASTIGCPFFESLYFLKMGLIFVDSYLCDSIKFLKKHIFLALQHCAIHSATYSLRFCLD